MTDPTVQQIARITEASVLLCVECGEPIDRARTFAWRVVAPGSVYPMHVACFSKDAVEVAVEQERDAHYHDE